MTTDDETWEVRSKNTPVIKDYRHTCCEREQNENLRDDNFKDFKLHFGYEKVSYCYYYQEAMSLNGASTNNILKTCNTVHHLSVLKYIYGLPSI